MKRLLNWLKVRKEFPSFYIHFYRGGVPPMLFTSKEAAEEDVTFFRCIITARVEYKPSRKL